MTDDEIRSGLVECEALLKRYKEFAKPIAEELARRQSLHVYKEEGRYSGDLGCYESGIDTICVHNIRPRDVIFRKLESSEIIYRLTNSFRDEIEKKFFADLKNVRLTGFR